MPAGKTPDFVRSPKDLSDVETGAETDNESFIVDLCEHTGALFGKEEGSSGIIPWYNLCPRTEVRKIPNPVRIVLLFSIWLLKLSVHYNHVIE